MEKSTTIGQSNLANTLLIGILALPSVFLFQSKRPLGLDKLHVILVQFLLVLLFKYAQALTESSTSTAKSPLLMEPITSTSGVKDLTDDGDTRIATLIEEGESKLKSLRKKSSKRTSRTTTPRLLPSPSLYEPHLLDRTLYNFLSITSPSSLSLLPPLPPPSPSSPPLPSRASLPTWTLLYSDPSTPLNIKVLQHPETKSLYAIQAEFPKIGMRNVLEVLTSVEKRKEWDTMCLGGETLERIEERGKRGSVGWIGMKGVAIIKAKDMVLLSLLTLLPPELDGQSITPRKRIVCATTSFNHPTKKLPTNQFNRMILNISGFIVEEMGDEILLDEQQEEEEEETEGERSTELEGSRIIQITDLSGLGSWIPSSVIRQVTQNMIPKSLAKLGEAAEIYSISESSRYPVEGNDWLPPLLGSWKDEEVEKRKKLKGKGRRVLTEEEEEERLLSDEEGVFDDEDEEEEDASRSTRSSTSSTRSNSFSSSTSLTSSTSTFGITEVPKITPHTIQSVLEEIRSVTSKLAALESSLSTVTASTSTSKTLKSKSWLSSLIYHPPPPPPPTPSISTNNSSFPNSRRTLQSSTSDSKRSKSILETITDVDYTIAIGTTLATGVAVGLIGLWGRRRQ